MDIFAHGLWSYAAFHRKKYVWMAVLFGLLPDFLSFGIIFVMNLFNGNFHRGPPSVNGLPEWLFAAYNMTHSLVMFGAVFALVYLFTKKWFWPLTAWAMHIIIDIPTHSFRYFPTPFLWPVSSYRFDGISWGTPWFMAVNYSALMAVFILIAHNKAKNAKVNIL
ncbi:CRISPR-associated DxTHG motif protein [Candidatus Woesearchaeota archaeon]|nr:CRISPR-associated DxTHG motif protein [Candidatus Woesearchaeota archaeon]